MIQLNNLSYVYPNGFTALENITMELTPGIYLLLGENGAGKTTLLHLIGGLRKAVPQQSCTLDGVPTGSRLPSVLSRTFVQTDDIKFPFGNIDMMVKYHAPFYPSFSPEMLRQNLDDYGMTGVEHLDRFSLGNRRKAQLAYVLALRPDVLLLDEPANGLDISSRQTLLYQMARCVGPEQTVIISTHTVWDFKNLFDGVMVLSRGRLVLKADIADLTERISFVSGSEPFENAFFMQQNLGQYQAIVPNDGTMQTDIDYALLYNAMHSPAASTIANYLNQI